MNRGQRIAKIVRDKHGMELTPDQAEDALQKALNAIRANLKAKGWDVPDDNEELGKLLKAAVRERS